MTEADVILDKAARALAEGRTGEAVSLTEHAVTLTIELTLGMDAADIFEVRGYHRPERGRFGPIALDGPLGAAVGEEPSGVMEVKHAGPSAPEWCRRLVGGRDAAEYSKFLMLSRLSFAEASAHVD